MRIGKGSARQAGEALHTMVEQLDFEDKATEILDDGTDQGRQDCRRCILRACGQP